MSRGISLSYTRLTDSEYQAAIMMNKDSRGVIRGRCTADGCKCDGYNGGLEGKKCHLCKHPPGKHRNVEAANGAGFSQTASRSHHSPPLSHHSQWQPAPVHLPQCQADGCTKPVWYEPSLQGPDELCAFTYCSPECRDRHLLPIDQDQLKQDLEDLKEELYKVAAADARSLKIAQESSTKRSSSSGGHGAETLSSISLTGAYKKQKTATVLIRKTAKQPLGLILSKQHCDLNERGDIGFMIVGVAKGSPVFNFVQSDQIKLLDVIESVNDTPCRDILSRDVDLQERFERYIEDKKSIKLILIHTTYLPISSPLAYAKKQSVGYKHVVVLMHSPQSVGNDGYFGLTLSAHGNKVVVKGVTKDSPADLSRVKFNDEICMYVVGSQEGLGPSQLVSNTNPTAVMKDMENAQESGWNFILFVQRVNIITYI